MKEARDLFEKLKKRVSMEKKGTGLVPQIFFQLKFDEVGAYLQVVDQKGNEVEVDYRNYTDHSRDLLKSIEHIRDKANFRINWGTPQERDYLWEYDFLIWQLKKCDNLVDASFNPLHFIDVQCQLSAVIIEGDQHLEIKVGLNYQGQYLYDLLFLNENHVLVKDKIFEIEPVGENFASINLFQIKLEPPEIEKYLSLLYSYFDNLMVSYKDYQAIEGPPRQTTPTLLFEKIDANNSLYLRILNSLPGYEADLFDNYELTKIVGLNDLEHKIVISEVAGEEVYSHCHDILKSLKKYKKNLAVDEKSDYFNEDNLFIIEENLAQEFIRRAMPYLLTRFSIFGAEKLKSYKVRAVTPKLKLSLGHGIDFLEGEAHLDIDGENIPLFDALSQYHKTSYIQLSDGTQAIINQAYIDKLERLFKKQRDGVKVSFFDLPIVEDLIEEKVAQAEEFFTRSREIFLGFNRLNDLSISIPELNATLRPYQVQGFKWLSYLHQNSFGGCLADDMGLGKTLEAITMLSCVYPGQDMPSMIIMPKSLLYNWEAEIIKFNPSLSYYIYYAQNRDLDEAEKHNLILTTYGMVRNSIEKFKEKKFYYLILDESQNIKNLESQISKAVMLLEAKYRLALSGTPIENNLGELYSLFRFLNPAMFGSVNDFNRYYASPIQQHNDKNVVQELKKKIYPFILRRLKKEVLKELPEKIEQVHLVEMNISQKKLYEARRIFYYQSIREQIGRNGIQKSQFYIFQALTELRQIASIPEAKSNGHIHSPKRDVLIENITESVANGHKVLVFANFLSAIDYIGNDLEKLGLDYLVMTGATRDRQCLVDRFQSDTNLRIFLMTLKTGGIGLNLTAADTIFIFDPWWNRAAENQAIDRTHRIGQDKTVFSYRLITRGSIEEKILQLQEKKKELFEEIISSDDASLKSLDEADIEFMLG